MTNFLVSKFVKNKEEINDAEVRKSYGMLSSIIGILCNIFLFILKYIMGTLSGSISIISDAFNNLSDCGSGVVTFWGYKMASKPADKKHPFGHGRIEYITSLALAMIIILVGIELLKGSVKKILSPEKIEFNVVVLISLIISIGIKLWLTYFNTKLGKKIKSQVMIATAKDSKNDIFATIGTLISLILSPLTAFPIDGIMGAIVSLFVLKAGYDICRETIDELVGVPIESEIIEQISEYILKEEKVLSFHDLMIHSYGPSDMIGSCHVEFKNSENFTDVHEIADRIERNIYNKLKIVLTIHADPVETENEAFKACKNNLIEIINSLDMGLSMHDFRMVDSENITNLIFDIEVPYECKVLNAKLQSLIEENLDLRNYKTTITFDRKYH